MGTEGVSTGQSHGVTSRRVPCSCSAAERILPVVDGVTELFQHDVQRGILRELDHEHARLHSDVPGIRGTCQRATGGVKTQPNTSLPEGSQNPIPACCGCFELFLCFPSGLMPIFFQ